jgi:hypothetical protein
MERESGEPDRDDQDREVSRRVQNPTSAEPGDEAVYRAADPVPDDSTASTDNDGGPVRSE